MTGPSQARPAPPVAAAPLCPRLLREPAAARLAADSDVLAAIRFTGTAAPADDPRQVRVPLQPLGAAEPPLELWTSRLPVEHGHSDGLGFARNGEVMLLQLTVQESDDDFEQLTYQAYRRIREFLESAGYPHPLRIWNYFPGINQGHGDTERYKQFCLGRARAIQDAADYELRLPAASAIGSRQPGLVIHLLAARQAGVQIENPRQVSAFNYPRQYGPKSPSFSRARLLRWGDEQHLYLSGTASVVGHETRHENDCRAQLAETLHNIDSLLEQAGGIGWAHLRALRVYLRHAEHLPLAEAALRERLGDAAAVYLQGDICRQDLLVEIEGVYVAPAAG